MPCNISVFLEPLGVNTMDPELPLADLKNERNPRSTQRDMAKPAAKRLLRIKESRARTVPGKVVLYFRVVSQRRIEFVKSPLGSVLEFRSKGTPQVQGVSLSKCFEMVHTEEGSVKLREYLESLPYPHYEPHPTDPELTIRIDQTGQRTIVRFVDDQFQEVL